MRTPRSKSEQEVNDNIANILEAMREVRKKTKDGYVKLNMSAVKNNIEGPYCVKKMFAVALQECKYIRRQGNTVNAMWHWLADEPTVDMAAKVYQKCHDLEASRRTVTTTTIPKNLVPIKDGLQLESSKRKAFEQKVGMLYTKTSDGASESIASLGVSEDLISSLEALGMVQRRFGGSMVSWTGDSPDADLIDVLLSEPKIAAEAGLKVTSPKATTRRRSASREVMTNFLNVCRHIYERGYSGAISGLCKTHNVPWYYVKALEAHTAKSGRTVQWASPEPTMEYANKILSDFLEAKRTGAEYTPTLSTKNGDRVPVVYNDIITQGPAQPISQPVSQAAGQDESLQLKRSYIASLEAEILADPVLGAEFSTLLQIKKVTRMMRASIAEIEKNMAPTQEKLSALSQKINYWTILAKELEGA